MRDSILFQVHTPLDYVATLRQKNWERHEQKHPEIRGQVMNIRSTLERPMLVMADEDDCHHYYDIGFGSGLSYGSFLHVLVQQFDTEPPGERIVVSAFFTRTIIRKGEVLWKRTSST